MTHARIRFVETMLKKDLGFSPCVGLVGMRQVGKSTLLHKFSKRYLSFDQEEITESIVRRGWDFLQHGDFPLAIDEIQKHPPAFDALKFAIDIRKIPGRYLISGSVRFGSRKGIRESLTGRMTTIELHPLTLAECHSKPPSSFLPLVCTQKANWLNQLAAKAWCSETALKQMLVSGGLPGICFRRDGDIKQRLWEAHLDTLLTRDIQLIRQVRVSPNKMLIILKELARLQGLPCSTSHLARLASLSVPGTKQILQAMEGLFLLRSYGETYFVEDIGLGHHLSPWHGTVSRQDMLKLLYHEFRVLLRLHFGSGAEATWHATRGGLDIPFLIKFKTGSTIAIGVDDDEYPSEKVLKSLTWYKKRNPQTKALVLCRRADIITASNDTLCLPWNWVF